MAVCPLPVRASVRDLLADLLGRSVTVDRGDPQVLAASRPAYAASYVLDAGTPTALCVCDLALASRAGAAIGMLPASEATEQIEANALTGDVEEFFREVVNILAKLLNSPTTPHVKLAGVHPVPGPVPAAVAAVALEPADRVDYTVTIDGYGSGALTVLAV